MPQVDGRKVGWRTVDTDSRPNQSLPQVIIFHAPPAKVLVVSVDLFVITPVHAIGAAEEPGLLAMTRQPVEDALRVGPPEATVFAPWYYRHPLTIPYGRRRNSLGLGLRKADDVSSQDDAFLPPSPVLPYKDWWQDAVSIHEHEILRATGGDSFIPALGELEAVVRMGDPAYPVRRRRCVTANNLFRLVRRAVVRDDDFEARAVLLRVKGSQRPLKMGRTLKRRYDDGHVRKAAHEVPWLCYCRGKKTSLKTPCTNRAKPVQERAGGAEAARQADKNPVNGRSSAGSSTTNIGQYEMRDGR